MSEMKNFNFTETKKVLAKENTSFSFELEPGFAMVAVFCKDPTESYCLVEPISNFTSTFFQSMPGVDALTQVKLISSARNLNSAETEQFKSLMRDASKSGIEFKASALRKGPLKGNLFFRESRIQIEKALSKIKLLIVDDSKTIRDLLTNVFSKDDEIEVVATAEHPHLVENLIQVHQPDVITLDIHMPDMDGVTLLKKYIQKYPIPTVMISSITHEDGPYVLNALESGAVDYIQKPSLSELKFLAPLMIEKIKEASRSKVRSHTTPIHTTPPKSLPIGQYRSDALIVIGSSTGGTEALKNVFAQMPENIPPVLVVQHIPPVFSKAFADRLDQMYAFSVKEAQDGDLVTSNQVLIAPGGYQMEVVQKGSELRVRISDAPPVNRHKPSVDYLFQSIEKISEKHSIVAAILTGMGADGARGLKALRDKGARTIAQDEQTSVVYGMPKEAAKLGGAEKILPLGKIGSELILLSSYSNDSKSRKSA